MGFDESAFNDPRLERIIRGGKRYYGDVDRRERFPITREILVRILQQIPDTYDGLNNKAALCLGFSAFLRAGEFTYDKWEETSPNFALTRSSISFEEDGNLVLTLPASKTDYFRKGVRIPLAAAPNRSPTCPAITLRTLFNRFPANPKAPLFAKTFGPFSRDHLIKTIRNALLDAGLSPTGFSGHSLRRGAAVSAVAAGIPRDEIKALGRWKSDAVDLYFKSEPSKILIHSRKLHAAPLVPPTDVPGILADLTG